MIAFAQWLVRLGLLAFTISIVTWALAAYNPDNQKLWERMTPPLFFGGLATAVLGVLLLGGV